MVELWFQTNVRSICTSSIWELAREIACDQKGTMDLVMEGLDSSDHLTQAVGNSGKHSGKQMWFIVLGLLVTSV